MQITTTVEAIFSSAHTDPVTGALHGHDYQTRATFPRGERFETLKNRLALKLKLLDHRHRSAQIWAAEDIVEWLLLELPDALRIEVNRPWLGHYATGVR